MWDNVCRNGVSMGILYHFMPAETSWKEELSTSHPLLPSSRRCFESFFFAHARDHLVPQQIYLF